MSPWIKSTEKDVTRVLKMKICIFLQCAISPTKTNYLAALFFTDIVNVYPQAINRMSSDENKNLSTLNPCDLQIISQQKRVNLAI